ncbi:helix-turn-helix domain-containing protein [Streptomyces sp. NPDC056437]|uniref:helix-turn-helix domain-containing protein n=1 Tax=Streptomyces sp. NPDC056437 TaxID=3345816 RepID=UPI0036D07031
MDRDWAEPLDLDAVAAHAGYSRYHFVRAFKAVYGQTPGQYLSRRRIDRAEELLRSANLSVTEICTLVGFSSLGTFSTRFKKQTGLTPSEYRAKHVGRGAALIPGCYALLYAGGFPGRKTDSGPGGGATGPRGDSGDADTGSSSGAGSCDGSADDSRDDPRKLRNSEEAG